MDSSEWLSAGALGIAALSIYASSILAPKRAAEMARRAALQAGRVAVYADTTRLLRTKYQELENCSIGWWQADLPDGSPSPKEAEEISALLSLYASPEVWALVQRSINCYWRAARHRMIAPEPESPREMAARLKVGEIVDELRELQDQALDAMRADLGTGPIFVEARRQARRDQAEEARRFMADG